MLTDWLWAITIVAAVLGEIAGVAAALNRLVFRKRPLAGPVDFAVSVALLAQLYFVLTLLAGGWGSAVSLHLLVLSLGWASLLFVGFRRPSPEPGGPRLVRLHLRLARYFSPMLWRKLWPWLCLPVLWAICRAVDALLPSNASEPLSMHLLAPHRWFEEGRQALDPLNPGLAAAGAWHGLFDHVIVLSHALWAPHRVVLARAQIACQLLHFAAGQLLSILILANCIAPFVKSGWNTLVHSSTSARRRHQLGMAAIVAVPSSICFAWIACARASMAGTSTLAASDWGIAALLFGALVLCVWPESETRFVPSRLAAAGFLWGTALATDERTVFAGAGLTAAALVGLLGQRMTFGILARAAGFAGAGAVAALVPLWSRNLAQAGFWFYPVEATSFPGPSTGIAVFFAAGIAGILAWIWQSRQKSVGPPIPGLIAYVAASGAAGIVFGPWRAALGSLQFAAPALLAAALGIEHVLTRPRYQSLGAAASRAVPFLWLGMGLLLVPIPVHVLWQNASHAFTPPADYLLAQHQHFEAKRWASLHLPSNRRIVWTSDDEFYYLEQQASSIPGSLLVSAALARASEPKLRASVLCDLGFDVLAWVERGHGPEVAGLAAWLRLLKGATLYAGEDVTFFDLGPACR